MNINASIEKNNAILLDSTTAIQHNKLAKKRFMEQNITLIAKKLQRHNKISSQTIPQCNLICQRLEAMPLNRRADDVPYKIVDDVPCKIMCSCECN